MYYELPAYKVFVLHGHRRGSRRYNASTGIEIENNAFNADTAYNSPADDVERS